ncbi:phosphotransferase family protein [Clostridium uliginosum]|uniref:Phosphotransferase enzyme family protein n=1 Tax=Clostridium uliginosum TaxID=119641 RepID=A0A1I1PAI7_9CLOT|nr:aminoglycoside phosphotransferase family protein [Clostridium uliginosum]SFD06726.1 Phosphotransferase enzyme family protein [Clostridium uliginosum]
MEYNWERSLPFLHIDVDTANKLIRKVLNCESIKSITAIQEGCRTSNYIIEIDKKISKYILKIFPDIYDVYEKENNLLNLLKKDIPVQKVYNISKSSIISNRTFGIYEYIDGETLGQAIKSGYIVEKQLVKDVAKSLAMIHKFKFDELGELDKNLKVDKILPPLYTWYEMFMGENFKRRLGENTIREINSIVEKNKDILIDLDKDVSLVHGDFQGTNILIKDKRLVGIIDWEFAMAGHSLADVGQFFRYKRYFNKDLMNIFEEEYNKYSKNKLIKEWYKIAKLRDLVNLIQLISAEEEMPNKYREIKEIILETIEVFRI